MQLRGQRDPSRFTFSEFQEKVAKVVLHFMPFHPHFRAPYQDSCILDDPALHLIFVGPGAQVGYSPVWLFTKDENPIFASEWAGEHIRSFSPHAYGAFLTYLVQFLYTAQHAIQFLYCALNIFESTI